MIWAILAVLGVPLWLCALGIFMVILQNRKLRKRYGDIPVRVRRSGKRRWTRGHAIWVSDVFAWRGSPAAWDEDLLRVGGATLRAADPEEGKPHRWAMTPRSRPWRSPKAGASRWLPRMSNAQAQLGPFGP